jgi:hypothetical protein
LSLPGPARLVTGDVIASKNSVKGSDSINDSGQIALYEDLGVSAVPEGCA